MHWGLSTLVKPTASPISPLRRQTLQFWKDRPSKADTRRKEPKYAKKGHLDLLRHLAAEQGMCNAFRRPSISCVAIVGNGPLDDKNRRDADSCQVIVRFVDPTTTPVSFLHKTANSRAFATPLHFVSLPA